MESIAFLSIIIVILLGGLTLFMSWSRKGRVEKEDYSEKINSFETLYKQGKLSKEEYQRIKITLLRKQGMDLPPELMTTLTTPSKPVRSSMIEEEKKEPEIKKDDSSKSES